VATISHGTDLATRLRLGITRTARRLRQEAGGDLSPSLTAALSTIAAHGPLTPSELATRERIQRPTATKVLARLQAQGVVARTADPQDRRSALVAITPAGEALLDELRTRKDAYLARRLRTLSRDERATLRAASEILERLLDEPRAERGRRE
jgi:DNA-binding MarR family transcriptional regulator